MTPDTRSSLLDVATAHVRRSGYSGFSYADLAGVVGIRKPSIHHHFPTKEDLGVAMVSSYTDGFSQQLDRIEAEVDDPIQRLRAYSQLYREGLESGQGCLCGVLASEMAILPARVQTGVRQFFNVNLRWLERVLRNGGSTRSLRKDVSPRSEARTVLASLQGAMLVAIALQEPSSFDHAVDGLLRGLGRVRA